MGLLAKISLSLLYLFISCMLTFVDTAGVTECQDGLLDLYTSLTSETTCSE